MYHGHQGNFSYKEKPSSALLPFFLLHVVLSYCYFVLCRELGTTAPETSRFRAVWAGTLIQPSRLPACSPHHFSTGFPYSVFDTSYVQSLYGSVPDP
jgi:hypothetical protein